MSPAAIRTIGEPCFALSTVGRWSGWEGQRSGRSGVGRAGCTMRGHRPPRAEVPHTDTLSRVAARLGGIEGTDTASRDALCRAGAALQDAGRLSEPATIVVVMSGAGSQELTHWVSSQIHDRGGNGTALHDGAVGGRASSTGLGRSGASSTGAELRWRISSAAGQSARRHPGAVAGQEEK